MRRIYCELELNLRIKPKKRLERETPEPLAVPESPNTTWSMDFMADQPGNPQQNTYIERYNRTVRTEWLGQYIWQSIEEVRDHATKWLWTYNNQRPYMLSLIHI